MPYVKEVFDVHTFDQAKDIVLTPDESKPNKFKTETEFTVDTILEYVDLNDKTILDFGCGMGRISKELINRTSCKVFGLDISESMLTFARLYTASLRFTPVQTYQTNESVDVALSILALQHSENPKQEIDNIFNVLKPNGLFILLNEHQRFVPSDVDSNRYVIWNDDGFDIFGYTESLFKKENSVQYLNSKLDIIFYRK